MLLRGEGPDPCGGAFVSLSSYGSSAPGRGDRAPRAPAFRRSRPIRRRTLRALTTHVLPDRLHSHDDARAGPRVHRRSLGATIIVANLVDAFPAVLAPIFGIRIVHGLSSSLGFDAFPAPSRKEKVNYPRLSKQLRAKATLVSSSRFSHMESGVVAPISNSIRPMLGLSIALRKSSFRSQRLGLLPPKTTKATSRSPSLERSCSADSLAGAPPSERSSEAEVLYNALRHHPPPFLCSE